ncbi:MAG: hypothetical protein GX795_02860 [Firmicutes bacterium]|jgi:hypothetical protein|nr:hypothetical protein [Bacillota bacterium]
MNKVSLVIFEGGKPGSDVEELVAAVRKAVVLDNLEKFSKVPELDRIFLYTTYEDLAMAAAKYGAETHLTRAWDKFHFGEALARVIKARSLKAVIYMGGASGSLMAQSEISALAKTLAVSSEAMLANNIFSSDIVGFTPASRLLEVTELPTSDNALAMALSFLHHRKLPETIGSLFDVDTPADVTVLGFHPATGPNVRAVLGKLHLEPANSSLRKARETMGIPLSEICVIGRVSPGAVLYVNERLQCRMRVFSEERGMKALGREDHHQVISLLGYLAQEVGFEGLVSALEKVADAVLIDTRVLFRHLGLELPAKDRFNSDLLRPDAIDDPVARRITTCFLSSEIPIVPGGHSLVSGGLRVLADSLPSPPMGCSCCRKS